MKLRTTWQARLLPLACLATQGLFGVAAAQNRAADLGQVLSSRPELSVFWGLVKNNTDFLLQLPSLGGVTMLAPNNDSFARVQDFDPKNKTAVNALLEYHTLLGLQTSASVVEGKRLYALTKLTDHAMTNVTAGQHVLLDKQRGGELVDTSGSGSRSTLVETDIEFAGGVVHVVDSLLMRPQRLETTGLTAYRAEMSAFVAALYAADVLPQFSESADVTIFAPSTAAFQYLAGNLTHLDKAELSRVLAYHLVPGRVLPAAALENGSILSTAADGARLGLGVYRAGNNMWLNSARVVVPDVLVANGIVHIIDSVLNPDVPAVQPSVELESQAPVFTPATGGWGSTGARAPTPFTSALPCTADCPRTTATSEAKTTTTGKPRTSSSTGEAAAAKCTGRVMMYAAVAGAAGVVGVGAV